MLGSLVKTVTDITVYSVRFTAEFPFSDIKIPAFPLFAVIIFMREQQFISQVRIRVTVKKSLRGVPKAFGTTKQSQKRRDCVALLAMTR